MAVGVRSFTFRLFLLGSLLSLSFLLYSSFDIDSNLTLYSSCPTKAYSSGKWAYHPRTSATNMTSKDDALAFSGFKGCASSREYDWHLATDNPAQWDRFPAAQSWQWIPGRRCRNMRKFEPEVVIKDLAERGGWLLIGDSVTENHFFSLSCMLYPHVLGSPNYTENPYFDRAWPQHLHLNPESPLVRRLKLPRGFNISTTPLVSFRRVDFLLSQQELVEIYRDANPDAPKDFKLFSDVPVWTLSPSEYLEIFTAPLPRANYRTMIVSTAGHWNTMEFAGLRDESKSSEGYGIDGVLKLFGSAMPRWANVIQSTLTRHKLADIGKRRVVVRAYLPGHEDCHKYREPWTTIQPFEWNWFNWAYIWEFNQIFETVVSDRNLYPDIDFLGIDRPARLRPDAHTTGDCLHIMAGAGVLEGWSEYIWHFVTREESSELVILINLEYHLVPFMPSSSPLASTPPDLLLEFARCLDSRHDLLNFCLASNYVFTNASAILYESVTLNCIEQCSSTLAMLYRRPDISRHTRRLYIRPQTKWRGSLTALENNNVSAAVRSLAASKRLDALVRFVWDADEMPLNEDMWFALRVGCPQLRYIGTSFGTRLPALNSHLFDFVNLSGFFLYLKNAFYENNAALYFEDDEPLMLKLWSMLIHNCPNLEELIFEGATSVPIHISHLLEGRWPKLRKLVLGDISVDWMSRPLNPDEKRPFISFLECHKNLRVLGISRHTVQPNHLASISPDHLRLTSFSGTHQQLQAIPHLYSALKSVTFREPVETREVSAPAVANLLREFTSLTDLNISFSLHSMYDSGSLLRSLIQSCPHLQQLALTCAQKPSFQLDTFAKTIQGFPKLHVLHLTIVKYPGDDTLSAGAARIAKSNPRLKTFSLTFIPPAYPLPIPVSIPYLPVPFRARASGSFTLACDNHGLPLSLSVRESCRFVWPWGLGVSSRTKKYVKDLRPLSSPSRRKGGFRGVLSLLLEASPAGEEMRMILFCASLVVLSMWGFFVLGR
ncbi:hypothetical protein APHAL10511_003784 [Amanita phalloides]|nr:hypothetical protein APHAL10511_003784 [Amanita phalloides]